ncbi:unnamed protein product [Clonostachys chloroleuca]|uniref:Uncharacterized protein n=1 Tax=Clonostachys chloroleuca TaxID=1926264 RepID=A0AA35PZ39_9HYPO|nr:unnamed protein product [Clonostachys chloroleuca]
MKHINDRIGLPIPIQRFFKIVYGISSVGLPVATTDDSPTCRVFTNHNGSEGRACNVKLIEGLGKAKLWEIAEAACAAVG